MSDSLDVLYRAQIAAAQEFLNENSKADLSRVKCLLHKMLPRKYFDAIESLKETQPPKVIFEINGGQNIIVPCVRTVQQQQGKDSQNNHLFSKLSSQTI